MAEYPQLFSLRQHRERPIVEDIPAEVDSSLTRLNLGGTVQRGESVAITAGSRGIANLPTILHAITTHLKKLGVVPFVVPAMGSHGGGTSDGQRAILKHYGIVESAVGCPIRASMDTVVVCNTPEGTPVHFDRLAFEADHVVVCNRIKPHTNFVGDIESGLMKMMLIGLGKHAGAKVYHRAIKDYSFDQIVRSVGDEVLERCSILAGVGILENAFDDTARVEAIAPQSIVEREKALLRQAKEWMPRLPFDRADVLLIDEIGKNISGSGFDTNVVGRKYGCHQAGPDEYPKIRQIVIRGLTKETGGNAAGIGLAEFCRSEVIRKMDDSTRINCLTAGSAIGAMPPLDYETDREILDLAFPCCGLVEPEEIRLMWIQNTLQVSELICSQAYRDEAFARDDLEVLSGLRPMQFDGSGDLVNEFGCVPHSASGQAVGTGDRTA